MTFHIVTTFPGLFTSYLGDSILARAIKMGKIAVEFYNPRDYATDKHHKTDDRPYSGGPGMVMRPEPILDAVVAAKHKAKSTKLQTFILSPSGEQFTNGSAAKLAKKTTDIILICGRYEGIDARVKTIFRAEEVSTGPYVLTGGELPALTMIDAMTRRIPGVLGKFESLEESRTASPDVYTRPEVYEWKGKKYRVPKVLRSGDHKKIDAWKETRIAMRKKKKGE